MRSSCFLFFLLVLFASGLSAQSDKPAPSPSDEYIFIHCDKAWYQPGETIWYKAYFFAAGRPSLKSEELFLQLSDPGGNIINRSVLPIENATTTGSMKLDAELSRGIYLLQGVTDFNADGVNEIYQKRIYILPSGDTMLQHRGRNVSLQFFPESGDLVDRVNTQIAFKALDEFGNTVDIKGVIKDQEGNSVLNFETLHDGMGRCALTPGLKTTLTAEFDFEGRHYRSRLPEVKDKGVCLKILEADSGKLFEVRRSRKDAIEFDTILMTVTLFTDTVFQSVMDFGNSNTLIGKLNTSTLPSGVLHFRISNKFGQPLAERLAFADNGEYRNTPKINVLQRNTKRKAKNILQLEFQDTVAKALSVSITDHTSADFVDKDHIYTRLLIAPHVRGYIHNASYYFDSSSLLAKPALDNLLLTQGWTRFKTDKDNIEKRSLRDSGVYLSLGGTVFRSGTKITVGEGLLSIQILGEDSSLQLYDLPVSGSGTFFIDSLIFFGASSIYHAYKTSNGKSVSVNLALTLSDNHDLVFKILKISDSTAWNSEEPEAVRTFSAKYARRLDPVYKELSNVTLKTRVRRPEDRISDRYASSLFKNAGKLILDNINHPYNNRTLSVIDYLLMNIRTIGIYRDDGTFYNRKNFSLQTQRFWKVELFIDETVSTPANAQAVTMEDVALIKFYDAGFVGVGTAAPGGAVSVYLKQNADRKSYATSDPARPMRINGYSLQQEFYQPVYERKSELTVPDVRTTLYWKSAFLPAGSKTLDISFYNNDFSEKLFLHAEGFDASGKLIHVTTALDF